VITDQVNGEKTMTAYSCATRPIRGDVRWPIRWLLWSVIGLLLRLRKAKIMTHHKTGICDPSHCYGSASEWLAAGLSCWKGYKGLTRRSD